MIERDRMDYSRSVAHLFQDRLMEQGMRMTETRETVARACGYAIAYHELEDHITASAIRDQTERFSVSHEYVPYTVVCRVLREMATVGVINLTPKAVDMQVTVGS